MRPKGTALEQEQPLGGQVVLSAEHDQFFKDNMFSNFGELGENMKKTVDAFKEKTKSTQAIDSIEDMKKFVQVPAPTAPPPRHRLARPRGGCNRREGVLRAGTPCQRRAQDYPAFRELSGNVEKHVGLVSELSSMVAEGNLMAVSELEQELACGGHNFAVRRH